MAKNKKSKKSLIVFGATAAGLVAIFTTVTVLMTNTFSPILKTVLGSDIPKQADGVEEIYKSDYSSKEESKKAGDELNKTITEEGFTLLLNEKKALPLSASERKVSVFGKNSTDLVLGGSGSGGISGTSATTIYDGLENAGIKCNPTLKSFYEDDKASGSGRSSSPSLSSTSSKAPTLDIGETPTNKYTTNVISSFDDYNDAAIVVISRLGGESWDLPRSQNTENGGIEGNHYLQLDQNEYDMLDMATSHFKKVIVVLNTLTSFQCDFIDEYNNVESDPRIDAVVWIGGPGSTGAASIGKLLTGDSNFSGRTVDIYSKDFTKDPTYQNFGDNSQVNSSAYFEGGSGKNNNSYIVYDENIYMGYRYYETRGYEESKLDHNINWYDKNVHFSFGYGLSYTNFNQTMTSSGTLVDKSSKLTFDVIVTNTGDYDGKDVIELYVSLPYTKGGIEKSHVQLVDFAKTSILTKNGGSETIQFSVDPYDLASYDYNDANQDGHVGYEVEAGTYTFYIAKNSHIDNSANVYQKVSFTLDSKIDYDTDPTTGTTITNLYTSGTNYDGKKEDGTTDFASSNYRLTDHYVTTSTDEEVSRKGMSRSDFDSTFPVAQTTENRRYLDGEEAAINDMTSNNDSLDNVTMPTTGASTTLTLRDLIGASYNDSRWDELLNSLTVDEMKSLVNDGAFETYAIPRIKKNLTNDSDGPIGFVNFMPGLSDHYKNNTTFACEIVIGATWNKDLAYQMGKAVGDNAVWGDKDGNGLPYSGWYAPAINLHRSPFAGRNFEYYSEDPILTGKLAVNVINGASTKGVYTDVKHFALNDQETNRAGVATYASEQTLREIYFKPFEMAVKGMDNPKYSKTATADKVTKYKGTMGMMSSFNRIGTKWTGGDYRLMTKLLRNEWGFEGLVICDYKTDNSVMNSRQMVYAGNDLILASLQDLFWNDVDSSSAKDITVLRKATKNILYVVANSNSMNTDIVGYSNPWWINTLIAVDIVVGVIIITWGTFVIFRYIKRNKEN